MVNLVVDLFVYVSAALVATGIYVFVAINYTSLSVVTSSISPPISVIGETFKDLGLTQVVLSLVLGRYALYRPDIMFTIIL